MRGELELICDLDTWWVWMTPSGRPCFTPALLEACAMVQRQVVSSRQRRQRPEVRYLVLGSRVPGVFNLGGDLALFARAVRDGDRKRLLGYALQSARLVWNQSVARLQEQLITIGLVQGQALGGGFEAALANHVLVAERGAQLGLPERRFGLFPGMGAYQLLSRRLTPAQAERMILSGELYAAEQLHALGVVDVLAEPGQGRAAVCDWIARHRRQPAPVDALLALRRRAQPLPWAELAWTAEQWVAAALRLQESDLRLMERLVAAQQRQAPVVEAA